MKYKTDKNVYNFQQFQTIKSFSDCTFNGKITINEANEKQNNLLENVFKSINALYQGWEFTLNPCKKETFPTKKHKKNDLKY